MKAGLSEKNCNVGFKTFARLVRVGCFVRRTFSLSCVEFQSPGVFSSASLGRTTNWSSSDIYPCCEAWLCPSRASQQGSVTRVSTPLRDRLLSLDAPEGNKPVAPPSADQPSPSQRL